jgi:single-stranded-DNA-specific exonuclease
VLSPFGIGVSVLTGETPDAERDKTFQALVDGRTHIVLTTPEFLAIHAARFARAGRVGFVVIDEAHHAGASSGGHRGAYAQLPQVLSRLGHPVVLACTATAGEEVAAEICDLLSIDHGDVVRDESVRDNLHVDDGRGIRDRERALVDLVRRDEKSVVYVNSREGAMALVRMLRHALPDQAMRISYYHAGLSRRERLLVERSFRDGRLGCIVATSAFGEGVNIPDIRHAVLYHLPFGEVEFNQMSGRAGRDGQDSVVHLMYQQRDRRINEHLLECNAPAREALTSLYRVLMGETRRSARPSGLTLDDARLAELASSLDARHPLDASAVSVGIGIFRELGFLRVEGFGETRRICMREHPAHADLEESACYLEGLRAKEAFADFSRWCFEARADELLKRINHPIAPSFGQLV